MVLDLSPMEEPVYIKQLYRMDPPEKTLGRPFNYPHCTGPRVVKLTSQSGCGGLLIGFESVSATAIKQMKKGFDKPEQYSEDIMIIDYYGIAIKDVSCFGLWLIRISLNVLWSL